MERRAIRGVELVGVAALRVAAGRDDCTCGQQAGDGVVHARHRSCGTCTWRRSGSVKAWHAAASLLVCSISMHTCRQTLPCVSHAHKYWAAMVECINVYTAESLYDKMEDCVPSALIEAAMTQPYGLHIARS